MQLTGKRILLREFTVPDTDRLHVVHSDHRAMRYYSSELGTREHARMLVEMFIRWANESPRQNFQLAIVDMETSLLLGSCGIRRKDCPPGQAEFGIGIDADWWGKGIAREAADTILRFAFSELQLHEVRGVAVFENEAVTRFMTKLGFGRGTSRQGDAWMSERGWSAVDWAITRPVFLDSRKNGRS